MTHFFIGSSILLKRNSWDHARDFSPFPPPGSQNNQSSGSLPIAGRLFSVILWPRQGRCRQQIPGVSAKSTPLVV